MVECLMISDYVLAMLAGVSFVVQQAVNSNLRVEIGSPWWAGFVSYLGGTAVMLVMAIVLRERWAVGAMHRAPVISWSGGLFGAIYIAISILTLPRLGAATVIALIVLGQLIGALAFDHFGLLGVAERTVTPMRAFGVMLVLVGAVLTRF
jgi:bacterial/archaeal transporter family-2 protein